MREVWKLLLAVLACIVCGLQRQDAGHLGKVFLGSIGDQFFVSDRLASDTDVWKPSGVYATAEEAVAAAKKIIDDQLEEDFRRNPDDRPLMLLDGLLDFGFLPYVVGPDKSLCFNAREYAEWKCYKLTGIDPPDKLTWDRPNV